MEVFVTAIYCIFIIITVGNGQMCLVPSTSRNSWNDVYTVTSPPTSTVSAQNTSVPNSANMTSLPNEANTSMTVTTRAPWSMTTDGVIYCYSGYCGPSGLQYCCDEPQMFIDILLWLVVAAGSSMGIGIIVTLVCVCRCIKRRKTMAAQVSAYRLSLANTTTPPSVYIIIPQSFGRPKSNSTGALQETTSQNANAQDM